MTPNAIVNSEVDDVTDNNVAALAKVGVYRVFSVVIKIYQFDPAETEAAQAAGVGLV